MKLFYILMILIFSTTIFSNELKDYSFTFQDEDLIIALKFDEEPDEEAFNLKNPFRLILKFKNTTLSNKIKAKNKINNEIINEIMTMQYARNGITNSKLIISLKKEVAYTVDKFGTRLLIILKNAKSNDKIAKHIEKNEKAETEKTKKTELEKNKNLIESINYQYDNEDLIFSIKMKKETKVKAFELSEPFRIFLDINGVELNEKLKKQYSYKDDYLKSLYKNTFFLTFH